MKYLLTTLVAFALSTSAFAQEIAGKYDLEGANPGGTGRYVGDVTVAATGDTYQVLWQIGNQKQEGTGILIGNTFAVSYRQGNAAGIAVFERGTDGTLTGAWAPIGSSAMGIEIWKPDAGM
ncbi:MAG: hypothetical protein H6887_08310 [Hoeflea sp.]|nr:hypothetical protein [Hoeflea sp.]